MPIDVPVLESERLVMRGLTQDDFASMVRFYADPVSQFYGGPCGPEEAWRKFAVYPGHWVLRGYGPWALESKQSGAFVGMCGPWFPEGWIEPEITWALVPWEHGKGYATEAARRALRAVHDLFGWRTAVSVIHVDNAASIAVADRLGATREAQITYRHGDGYLYRHQPPTRHPAERDARNR